MGQRQIQAGTGWRLGWDGNAPLYKALLAGSDWAIELTAEEFQDFCRLVHQLATNMAAMATELMAEERITCEAESESLWMEVEGFPDSFSLRFIVQSGRRCEGMWSAEATRDLLAANCFDQNDAAEVVG